MAAIEFAADDLDRFIGIPETAARLGIHPDTARAWIRKGRWAQEFPTIPVVTVGGKQMVPLRAIHERTVAAMREASVA